MMKSKNEMRMEKLALAAFFLGVFALNPMARAEEPALDDVASLPAATQTGVSLEQLRSLSPDLKISIAGEALEFTGTIPRKCAAGRNMNPVDSSKVGQHSLMIELPGCAGKPLTIQDRADKVPFKAAFPQALTFDAGHDGKFFLRYSPSGDGTYVFQEIKMDGKVLEHVSAATIAKEAAKKAEEAAGKVRVSEREKLNAAELARRKALRESVEMKCKAGDTQGVRDELVAALGDMRELSAILSKVDKIGLKRLEANMRKAKDPDSLTEAYEAYKAAAEGQGVDMEVVAKAYLESKGNLIKEIINDTSKKPEEAASAIRDLVADYQEAGLFDKEAKQRVAILYGEVATRLGNAGKLEQAEKYYEDAMKYTDDKSKILGGIAKMYNDAALACLDKNKANPRKCDKLAEKANKNHEKMVAQMKKDGDDSWQEAAFEQVQMFGRSKALGLPNYAVNMGQLGRMRSVNNEYQQKKLEGLREAMMQKAYGGAQMGAGTESGSSGYTSLYK